MVRTWFRPWTWSVRGWLLLILVVALGLGAAWGGRQTWAWHHFKAGEEELARYHSAEARRHLDVCLSVWPNDAATILLSGRAARRAGDFGRAEDLLRTLPRSDEGDLEWALLQAASGELDRIDEFLISEATKKPRLAPLIWEALAEGYLRVYRIREAQILIDRWLKTEPDNVQARFLHGEIYRRVRQLSKTIPDYQRVLELDPSRYDARKWLALAMVESGRYADALAQLERLRHDAPKDADLTIIQARALKGQGRYADARQLLDDLLVREPNHRLALRARGEVELAERPAEAEKWLRKAAAAAPYDYQTQFLLMQSLIQQGKEKEAQAQRSTVDDLKDRVERLGEIMSVKLSSRPHDPALYVEMGKLLISLGEKDAGRNWLETALTKDANFRPAHAALAVYFDAAGDTTQAAQHRRQAGN